MKLRINCDYVVEFAGLIKQKLDSYRRNCRARSLLFYCKVGRSDDIDVCCDHAYELHAQK